MLQRLKILTGLSLSLILISLPSLSAASTEENLTEQTWNDFRSPYTTPVRPYFLFGSALALTFAILEDTISDPLQEKTISKRPLGNFASDLGSLAGSLIPNLVYTGSMLLSAAINGNSETRAKGNLMFRATAYAQATTTALKFIIREPRPDGSGEKVSFPSGHSTGAFSFASVIQAEHGWISGGIAYTYAALVAYSRMNDNRHLLHDVVAGATIGASFGLGLHYRKERQIYGASYALHLLPTEQLDGALLAAAGSF
jgi:membrane-associated phospholipid phosphatase